MNDKPDPTPAEPAIALPNPWEWERGDNRWIATRGVWYVAVDNDENLGICTDGSHEGPPTTVILAVLEANASPALEERDRRVRATYEDRPTDFDESVQAPGWHPNSIHKGLFSQDYGVCTKADTWLAYKRDSQLAVDVATVDLRAENERLAADVEVQCLRAQRAKLRADLSAALAERDEARRELVEAEADEYDLAPDLNEVRRRIATGRWGEAVTRRLYPAPADPEGGPTE